MFIHWFPGHMTKAMRMMEKEIALVDCVIYVLDSRAPASSVNAAFEPIIGKKKRLYILNKADLVPAEDLKKWQFRFEKLGYKCITTNSASKADAPKIVKNLLEINGEVLEKYRAKGVRKTVRAMVIGIPNSGKSTLINSLTKEKKAVTGNKPGVTRGKQWVSIDDYIELLDSPGVLYPDFSDQDKALRLALIGSIKDDVLDAAELGVEAIKFLSKTCPEALKERYSLESLSDNAVEILECIGKKRGLLLKGGDTDYEKAAGALITDYRKGYLGKIILDKL